jgi:hypothetical protein
VCKYSVGHLNTLPTIKETGFHYNKIPAVPSNNSISLHGYYQSYKYFESYQDKIYSLLLLSNKKKMIQSKYSHLLNGDVLDTISMHFRLGDYKEKQHFHPIMPKEYYKNALAYILQLQSNVNCKTRVLYFCEIEDIAYVSGVIDYLRIVFSKSDLEFIGVPDNVEDWEQMLLMSCCKYNIVANSSFSWWGAYFNQNKDKCVCYPSVWFGEAMGNIKLNDLFPPDWVKIGIYER